MPYRYLSSFAPGNGKDGILSSSKFSIFTIQCPTRPQVSAVVLFPSYCHQLSTSPNSCGSRLRRSSSDHTTTGNGATALSHLRHRYLFFLLTLALLPQSTSTILNHPRARSSITNLTRAHTTSTPSGKDTYLCFSALPASEREKQLLMEQGLLLA